MTPTISEIDGRPALVVLEGGWRDEYVSVITEHELTVLSIMVRGDDLSFLRLLPDLRGLVLNAGEVRDLSVLESLRSARDADAQHAGKPRMPLDFGAFARAGDPADVLEPGLRVGLRLLVAAVAVGVRAARPGPGPASGS